MESRYDPIAVEGKIRKFWEEKKIFEFDLNDKREVYSIDTPPPTVSGQLHVGHIFSYSQAEFIARYKRMRGFNVFYPFGLDNNGLPTELLIEKKHNTTAERLGREKFVGLVKKDIKEYNEKYIELFKTLGLSVDWSLTYQTISDEVQRISQRSFLELKKINRVYRKEAPVLYCPKDRTTVSQMELKDKMLKSRLIYVKFSKDVTIATSRPELLPACVAVFVNPTDTKHKKLIGKTVAVPIFGQDVEIRADERVDPAFGTGVVMCCTFGDVTDIEWYKAYDLPLRMVIDENGRMTHEYFRGMKIKEAREKILNELREKKFILKEEEIEHAVNVHERCDTEIEFILKKQWYVRYLDLKEKFLELGRKVKWYPEYMVVRYENWVNGLKWDWGISMQRFFGVYFPVWYCKKCGETKFAREQDLPVDPFVDKPKSKCERCGSSEFVPETDIMNTWATSSLTPLINARWGIDDKYLKSIYPMSLRAQAYDIISFWTFTTIVKSHFHTDSIPWNSIMISGQGLDPQGKPMHKHEGNVIYPEQYFKKYGADAVRYWASSSVLGEDNSFQEKEVVAGARLINKLWNVARFVQMNCEDAGNRESGNLIDRWILYRMYETIGRATGHFDVYDYFKARNSTEGFFWEFSNDYLEFVKNRVYKGDKDAKRTLRIVLINVLKMLAPFIPFVTEEIYQEMFRTKSGGQSLHTSEWPRSEKMNKDEFESGMLAANAIREIRKKKHDGGMALNEQLAKVTVYKDNEKGLKGAIEDIESAMNVQEITFEGKQEGEGMVKSIEK